MNMDNLQLLQVIQKSRLMICIIFQIACKVLVRASPSKHHRRRRWTASACSVKCKWDPTRYYKAAQIHRNSRRYHFITTHRSREGRQWGIKATSSSRMTPTITQGRCRHLKKKPTRCSRNRPCARKPKPKILAILWREQNSHEVVKM